MASNADFMLNVGLDSQASFTIMKRELEGIINALSAQNFQIKVSLALSDGAKQSIRSQISQVMSGSGTTATGANGGTTGGGTSSQSSQTRLLTNDTKAYTTALKQTATLLNQVTNAQTKWTAAKNGSSQGAYQDLSFYETQLRTLIATLREGKMTKAQFDKEFTQINSGFLGASNAIKAVGENTQSITGKVSGLMQQASMWFNAYQLISLGIRAVRAMYQNVLDLDNAMLELKKVTDESNATYARFLDNATVRAQKLGASISDVVNATADFARLGYEIEEAEKLADVAVIYKNVGDGIDNIKDSTESIIATIQAFHIPAEEAMSVADIFNEVGNNYAISAKGVGDALLRSAAAMSSAGNTVQETVALATAANTVVQSPEKVGTALKTMSMYLRASKTEAEDAGESTDGMAESVSKLRGEILALTGNKVDIQLDENTFKSSYQILKELAGVWNQLTDISKANLLERLGGKRNANVMAAILENFSVAERALQTAYDSSGSALRENAKVLDAMQGRINLLKVAVQDISQTAMSSGFLKGVIDSCTKILTLLNDITKALGGLGMALATISALIAALNLHSTLTLLGTIATKIVGIGKAITSIQGIQALSYYIRKFLGLLDTTSTALVVYDAKVAAVGQTMAASAGLTAGIIALTAALVVYRKYQQAQEEARRKTLEETKAVIDETNAIRDAYVVYTQYANKTDLTSTQEEDLKSAVDQVTQSLGDKTKALKTATEGTKEYADALKGATDKELQTALTQATKEKQAVRDAIKAQASKVSTPMLISIDNPDNYPELKGLDNYILRGQPRDMLSPYGDNGEQYYPAYALGSYLQNDHPTAIVDYYYVLLELQDRMAQTQNTNNRLYSNATTVINNLKDSVEGYVKALYDELSLQYQIKNGIPTTREEFAAYRKYLQDQLGDNFKFDDGNDKLNNIIDGYLSTNKIYADFITQIQTGQTTASRIEKVEQDFERAAEQRNAERWLEDAKKFREWADNLTTRDKEIVYAISLNKDTAEWDLQEWKDQLDEVKSNAEELATVLNEVKDNISIDTVADVSGNIGSVAEIYKELSDKGYVTTKTLGALKTATNLSDSEFKEYEALLLNATSATDDVNQALSDLTYKILDQKFATASLNDLTEDQIVAVLREQGVVNADAVAHDYLMLKKEQERVKTALLTASTLEEALALHGEAIQAGITEQAFHDLVLKMILVNNTNLDVSQQIAALQKLRYFASLTAEEIAQISNIKTYTTPDGTKVMAAYKTEKRTDRRTGKQTEVKILAAIETVKPIDIQSNTNPYGGLSQADFTSTGGKSGGSGNSKDNAGEYKDPTDAIINRINLNADELEQQEKQINNLISIAELKKDRNLQLDGLNDLLNIQKNRVLALQKANEDLHNEAEYLRSTNSFFGVDTNTWFDSQGNETEAYYAFLNSGITKDEKKEAEDFWSKVSKYKKAYQSNADKILLLNKNIPETEQEISKTAQDIFSDMERYVTRYTDDLGKQANAYDILIDKNKALVDSEKKYYDTQKKIREAQRDITKELNASKKLASWLDEDTRKYLFNEQDYNILSSRLQKLQNDTGDIYKWYQEQINSLTKDNWYLEESITKEYERRLAAKEREYEIAKAELNLAKKQSELNNILAERNVSMVIGGQLQRVADFTKVKEATEELASLEDELAELRLTNSQEATLAMNQAQTEGLMAEKAAIENRVKMIKEQTDEMKKAIEDFIDPIQSLATSLDVLTERFNIKGMDEMADGLKSTLSGIQSAQANTSYGGYSFYLPSSSNKVVRVQSNWKAPSGLSEGDVVLTAGGAYRITNVNPDGSYISGRMDTVDYSKLKGYASGTTSASGGWRRVNEIGPETYVGSDGTFHKFGGGEVVFTKEQTSKLMNILDSGFNPMNRYSSGKPNVGHTRAGGDTNYSFGDIIVNAPRDYNDFLWQLSKHIGNKTK